MNFEHYSQEYKYAITADNEQQSSLTTFEENSILIKGDISGIQDFIFNIKSRGAAKELKARSFAIQAICEIVLQAFKEKVPNAKVIYNAGGNFYLLIPQSEKPIINIIKALIEKSFVLEDIFFSLSSIEIELGSHNFGDLINLLEKNSAKDKLQKFALTENPFIPRTIQAIQHKWKEFNAKFIQSVGFSIEKNALDCVCFEVGISSIKFMGYSLQLQITNDACGAIFNDITQANCFFIAKRLPIWDAENMRGIENEFQETPNIGNVITFEQLASLAFKRTGTAKIGVCKFDVDNLGKIFQKIKNLEKSKQLSHALKYFFEFHLTQLLDKTFTFNRIKYKFADNIYIIFSGGDDAFMVGAWDAILEFISVIESEILRFCGAGFYAFTISKAILVLDDKYPVKRFAQMAEDALMDAKTSSDETILDSLGLIAKNRYSLLGQVVDNEDFKIIKANKDKLFEFVIKYKTPKAILQAVQQCVTEFNALLNSNGSTDFSLPKVWRMRYYFRNDIAKGIYDQSERNIFLRDRKEFVEKYEQNLLQAYEENNLRLLYILPLAARWTEFLTRYKK